MQEARYYEKRDDRRVLCRLCAQYCRIGSDNHGKCGVRRNVDGKLFTSVYGRMDAANVDPIEKKPLYHFHPGSSAFSLATIGCNLSCTFCQNWHLSQPSQASERHAADSRHTAEEVVRMATEQRCRVVAYTYSEPTVFYEWAYDIAKEAAAAGLLNVFVTNGYIAPQPLRDIQPYLHGANVDLKAFDDATYKRIMGARGVAPVLDTLKSMVAMGIWVEVTTLLVPTRNDSAETMREISRFIADELGLDVPWHISRFHPDYRETALPPTSIDSMRRAYEIGLEAGLRYVYPGNISPSMVGANAGDTSCHSCNATLIDRSGYNIVHNRVAPESACPRCGTHAAGVGMCSDVSLR